jgi:GTPase SAR1 family protein
MSIQGSPVTVDQLGPSSVPSPASLSHAAECRPPLPTQGRVRIGLHAPRSVGKTTWLACVYGNRSDNQTTLTVGSPATVEYLKHRWEQLLRCESLKATAGQAVALHFSLTAGEGDSRRTWDLEVCDYPGEYVELQGQEHAFRQEFREWLFSCHAVMVFIDVHDPDMDRLNELDLLIQELRRGSADGKTMARPMVLVLNKWDLQRRQISGDADEERRHALELQQIRSRWLTHLQKHTEELLRSRMPNYAAALKLYQQAEPDFREDAEQGEQLAKEMRCLHALHRRRKGRLVLALGLAVMILLPCGLAWSDWRSYERAAHDARQASSPAQLEAVVNVHDEALHPSNWLLGWRGKLNKDKDNRMKELGQREFAALLQFRQEKKTATAATARNRRCQKWLADYGHLEEAAQVLAWQAIDDREAVECEKVREEHERRDQQAWASLSARLRLYPEKVTAEGVLALIDKQYVEKGYLLHEEEAKKMRQDILDKYKEAARLETAAREKWKAFISSNPGKFEDAINGIDREYLSQGFTRHLSLQPKVEGMAELRQQLVQDRDRAQLTAIKGKMNRNPTDQLVLEECERDVQAIIDRPRFSHHREATELLGQVRLAQAQTRLTAAREEADRARTSRKYKGLIDELNSLRDHPGAATIQEEVNKLSDSVAKHWDDHERRLREDFARTHPKEYRKTIKQWEEYRELNLPGGRRHDAFAQKAIKAAETAQDREQYEELQAKWKDAVEKMDLEPLETALGLAEDYLKRKYGVRRMQDAVKKLVEWREKFDRDARYEVRLKSIHLPEKSLFTSRVGTVKIDLILNFGEEEIKLEKLTEEDDFKWGVQSSVDRLIGKVKFQWGTETKLRVKLYQYNRLSSDDKLSDSWTCKNFALRFCNRALTLEHKSGDHVVELSCLDVTPPSLKEKYPQ